MDSNIKKFKQLALKGLKSKKSVEEGEKICSDMIFVDYIYDNSKLKLSNKIELLDRYIPGLANKLASSNQKDLDLLTAKTEFSKKQSVECQKFLKSIGVTDPIEIKKITKDLNPIEKGKKICHGIAAVDIIYDNKNIKLDTKVKLLDRYISGLDDKLASSNQKDFDLLAAKTEFSKKQTVDCQNFLKSIGVIDPKDIKKFMDDLLGTKPKAVSVPVKQRISTDSLASSGSVKLVKKITLKPVRTPSYEAPVLSDSARNSVINAGTLIYKSPIDMD
jgi:hypothetical protein